MNSSANLPPSGYRTPESFADLIGEHRELDGQYFGRCPACGKASLSWRDSGDDARPIVVTCQDGCALAQIANALGLETSAFDFSPYLPKSETRPPGPTEIKAAIGVILADPELKPGSEGQIKVHDALVELLARIENKAHRKVYAQEAQALSEKFREIADPNVPKVSATDILREIAAKEKEADREQDEDDDGTQGTEIGDLIRDPDPWPDPVEGEELLDELAHTFSRFLALSDGVADAVALWVTFAHTLDVWSHAPMLAIVSPEKGCGKSRLLEVLASLVPRALNTSGISPAAVFRITEKYSPTLLVDEADSFAIGNEGLRGILNAGHTRAGAYVLRCVGDDFEPRAFCVWGAKALAMIQKKLSDLPPTWEHRSIVVRMARRTRDEPIDRITSDTRAELERIKSKVVRWARDNLDQLRGADPELPDMLGDRAWDNWRPLVAIADRAGGEWPERARRAAKIFAERSDDESIGVLLLTDIRDLFESRGVDRLFSKEIADSLKELDDRPWLTWGYKRGLSPHSLAGLLAPFGVRPSTIRIIGSVAKGYRREDFESAWERYIPVDLPPQTATPLQVNSGADSERFHTVTNQTRVTAQEPPEPAPQLDCYDVTVARGGYGEVETKGAPPPPPAPKRGSLVVEGPGGVKVPAGSGPMCARCRSVSVEKANLICDACIANESGDRP